MGATTGIVGGIIATILLTWLSLHTNPRAEELNGRMVLRYGRPIRVLGWVMLAIGAFIAYAASQASPDQRAIAWIVGGALLASGVALWLEFHIVRIEYDRDTIFTFSPWRKKRAIPWNEITDYAYSDMNRWHIIKTKHRGHIRVSVLLSGLESFFGTLKEQKVWPTIASSVRSTRGGSSATEA